MKNYKDTTIKELCTIINHLADTGCMLDEEEKEYIAILNRYSDQYEAELLASKETTPYTSFSNCVVLKNREDGEVTIKAYEDDKQNTMMRDVSSLICFSDCDDIFEVVKIIFNGREVEYTGWQPGMVMSYEYTETVTKLGLAAFPSGTIKSREAHDCCTDE